MSLLARYVFGVPAAALGTMLGGPGLGYVAWKGVGLATTGNPLYLLPGSTLHADGATFLTDLFDGGDTIGPDGNIATGNGGD